MGKFFSSVMSVVTFLGLARAQEGWEVSGRVTVDSRPVRGMYVLMSGPSNVPSAVTDAQGSYSVKGVVPGQYVISVQNKGNTNAPEPRTLTLTGGMRVRVDLRIPQGSVVSGRVLDRSGRPIAGLIVEAFLKTIVDRRLRMYVQGGDKTNDLGQYRIPFLPEGVYVVAATASEPLRTKVRSPASSPPAGWGYPRITFHPGTRDLQAAGVLELRDGAEQAGVDIMLQQEPTRCLFFKIGEGFAGERVGAAVQERLGFESLMLSDARVAVGQSYEVCGLVPGEYQLSVLTTSTGTKAEAPGGVELGRNLQILGYQVMTALLDTQNVDLGTVEPLVPTDVHGALTIQDAGPGDSVPGGTRVRLVASELRALYADMRPAQVQRDGKFILRQVFPGDYGVRVDLPGGYYLIGVYQRGRSVSDGGFYPGNGDLQITLGADGCQLTGRVVGEDGLAVPDASVMLVPRKPGSHHVVQTDQTGTYRFTNSIAPGSYRLVAARGLMRWHRTDSATAARLAAQGMDLELSPRESRIMDLKVRPIP